MKNILLAIFFIASQAINTPTMAQNAVSNIDSKLILELTELKQEKVAIETKSKEQEAACYKKFAVSSCLKEVKTEKLAALNGIKLRELAISDRQRLGKEKAVQLKKDKSDASNQSKEASKALQPENSGQEGITRKSEKIISNPNPRTEKLPADEQQRINAASKRVADVNAKLAAAQKKAQMRAKKQSQTSEQSASYAKKVQLAEEHKNELAKKQADKTKAKSAPLPIPSAAEIAR
jgi:colicin import membrane protein